MIYRSATMILNYYVQDTYEAQYAIKEASREVEQQRESSEERLKRALRFISGMLAAMAKHKDWAMREWQTEAVGQKAATADANRRAVSAPRNIWSLGRVDSTSNVCGETSTVESPKVNTARTKCMSTTTLSDLVAVTSEPLTAR